jgi:hypothetical protein
MYAAGIWPLAAALWLPTVVWGFPAPIVHYVTTVAGNLSGGYADGFGKEALFASPYGLCVNTAARVLYVSDQGNYRIRMVDLNSGAVATVSGDRQAGSEDGGFCCAQWSIPAGLALDPTGGTLFVADQGNAELRSVTMSTSYVTTVADYPRPIRNISDVVSGETHTSGNDMLILQRHLQHVQLLPQRQVPHPGGFGICWGSGDHKRSPPDGPSSNVFV